jgi:signal transduction histidine kinase/CheY-like chemotaxis protein
MTEQITRSFRILVVDDEQVVQSLVRDALEDEGHAVLTAGNGEEALALLATESIDLLITDIRMPKMDGIELVERMRETQPAVGVVFITGYASLNSAKDAIKHGALDYVMKPFELHEIRQAVHNAITKLSEAAEINSDQQLESLSDLSHMLFSGGDRQSLVTSSLKFAMMHQHSDRGSILYWDRSHEQYVLLSIENDQPHEQALNAEPLAAVLREHGLSAMPEPCLVNSPQDHPLYRLHPTPELGRYLFPPWMSGDRWMITVPIMRSTTFFGLMMLESDEDTVKVRQTDMKFLSITTGQLAITLENVSLLEETREAYSRLKELQDETIQLEKMAARGEMSAEIGHELNNFLGVVAGNVALLEVHLKKQNYDQLDKYLTAVNTTIEKIKTFTANLMDLRSISSRKETVYFDRIISEVVEYLRPQKRFRGVVINTPGELESLPMLADATQIQQLLYNLFNNAADATRERDSRVISVQVEPVRAQNSFRVSIRDTGVGFEPDKVTKAFHERFTTKPDGHGFGLVVCKRIIDHHGGKLEVETAPGEGTCITITFPQAMAETEEALQLVAVH